MTMSTEQPVTEERRRSNSWKIVVAVLFALSTVIGVLAYWRFIVSDRFLREDLEKMARVGRSLSVEQCVDATVAWAGTCRAMKSLCDATGPQLMRTCLAARDRSDYCNHLGDRAKETHFGFKECKARKVTRKTKKACAAAYRAIASHCQR